MKKQTNRKRQRRATKKIKKKERRDYARSAFERDGFMGKEQGGKEEG